MKLRLIGYWEGANAPGWPRPDDFVDAEQDAETARLVCDYLDDGMLARAFMGKSACRLCGRRVGSLEKTDGVYIWPEGLSHYVREHSVRLPREFFQHALRYRNEIESATIEEEWWREQVPTGNEAV